MSAQQKIFLWTFIFFLSLYLGNGEKINIGTISI
jgi:hypothetical protein